MMDTLQSRILVTAVDGEMVDPIFLEELDEVDSEEALPAPPFAVENKVAAFV